MCNQRSLNRKTNIARVKKWFLLLIAKAVQLRLRDVRRGNEFSGIIEGRRKSGFLDARDQSTWLRETVLGEKSSSSLRRGRSCSSLSDFPEQTGTIRARFPLETKYDTASSPPSAGRTIFFHFFLPLFKLLSFAIDIYFAIYRHTYRIYLHKLCNTDEAYAPPRRTTYTSSCPVLSHPSRFLILSRILHVARLVRARTLRLREHRFLDIPCAASLGP